ncbi:hypothetical protein BDZ97DRAFT_263002, partial [Flammula alnicola]
ARQQWWDPPQSRVGQKRRTPNSDSDADISSEPRLNAQQNVESPPTHPPSKKACYIIQQVYAQLVRNDATFAVISSGNFEIIVRRHRESQTLHLSHLIQVSKDDNPSHYKLHVSLYIMAFFDSLDRAKQLEDIASTIQGAIWLTYYQRNYHYDYLNYQLGGFPSTQTAQEEEAATNIMNEELLSQLAAADKVAIKLPRFIRSDETHHIFYRKPLSSDARVKVVAIHEGPDEDLDPGSKFGEVSEEEVVGTVEPCLEFESQICDEHVELEIEPLEDSSMETSVWSVTLTRIRNNGTAIPEKQCYAGRLILKFAMTKGKQKRLQNEYAIYSKLSDAGASFLVRHFGLFTSVNDDLGYDALIMDYGGTALSVLLKSQGFQGTKARHYQRFLKAVESLHGLKYLHNGLTSDHVLFHKNEINEEENGKKGKVYLISFADAESEHEDENDVHKLERLKKKDGQALRLAFA